MNNQQQETQVVPVTNKTAVAFGFLFLFMNRFSWWFGTVFGAISAIKVSGLLPGLFQ
ncbi:MAG: hypothetical protein PHE17_19535 [Thiothrix sp.]|uniref:hypothetical protein n=1 Tax=Thiothrix sp. TaxID=1032 RepID=UPI002629A02C|nr:hypothetical protein [Thiothrix sp.]MDD5395221.1 hypothetical protein [Thiothrix sp.]